MTDTIAPQPIAVVDVESDGLHHGRQVWEVAIIRRELGALDQEHHFFVQVPGFRLSDAYGLNVGKFFERHPRGRELAGLAPIPPGIAVLSTRSAAERVHQLLFDAHIVGVNPTFDVVSLSALLRGEGLPDEPWDYHLEDLVAETAGYLRGLLAVDARLPRDHQMLPEDREAYGDAVALPWKSDQLAAAIGVPPAAEDDRHTALGDARWALRWHDTLTGLTTPEVTA